MQSRPKIGILGGDARQLALCRLFADKGFECATWGLCGTPHEQLGEAVKCVDWKCAVNGAEALILPLPVTTDGVRLNCRALRDGGDAYAPRITEIIERLDRSTRVFAGKVPPPLSRFAAEHGIALTDYYESEQFQIKNAVPTAEGAIGVAISELDVTLAGAACAVVGYGRIGRTLALRLCALGCNTYCIARSERDLAWASCDGCTPLTLADGLSGRVHFDAIFNTVPHMLFDREALSVLSHDTVIIDLASQGCGVDSAEAERCGIRTIKALSLPGKTSPKSAGKIIFEAIYDALDSEVDR